MSSICWSSSLFLFINFSPFLFFSLKVPIFHLLHFFFIPFFWSSSFSSFHPVCPHCPHNIFFNFLTCCLVFSFHSFQYFLPCLFCLFVGIFFQLLLSSFRISFVHVWEKNPHYINIKPLFKGKSLPRTRASN